MTQSGHRDALQLSSNALTVLEKRYLIKDEVGKPTEQSEDLFWRVAHTIAAADQSTARQGAVGPGESSSTDGAPGSSCRTAPPS
jgi:ribonucleotide reductase alpha subunit